MNPNKALWEKGDFGQIAAAMREAGDAIAKALVKPNLRVLDVGCGDGTTAIPFAQHGATVTGLDIAPNLVAAGKRRAKELGIAESSLVFQEGDVSNMPEIKDQTYDLVYTQFGAMFAPRPLDVAKELVRVTRKKGTIIMANWIPNDPSFVSKLLVISSKYTPPPPEGFVSPMLWGVEANVVERFGAAGIPKENITFSRENYFFNAPGSPVDFADKFRLYYGPTMNAFEAATKAGRVDEFRAELENLFKAENKGPEGICQINATYLKVVVNVP